MDEAEPTLAADLADSETQSIHAWSQEDDATEVGDYRPRSWKTPLALIAVAVAALVGLTAWTMWPQSHNAPAPPVASAPKPQVAPQAPAPQDPVSRYAALYRSRGGKILPGYENAAADEARNICREVAEKGSVSDEINGIIASSPGFNRYNASVVTDSAIEVFCPQYSLKK